MSEVELVLAFLAGVSKGGPILGSRNRRSQVRKVRKTGRGERDSPATNDLPVTMLLAEPPAPLELVRSA